MARGYKYFEAIEKNAALLGILIVVMVSLGGLSELPPLAATATALAYSPDGAFLVSGGADGGLAVRDARSGEVLREMSAGPRSISCVESSDICFSKVSASSRLPART